MRFPIKESDIEALANSVAGGLAANTAIFPAPPVLPAQLEAEIITLDEAHNALIAAEAAYKAALEVKNAAIEKVADHVKKDLRYAENITGFNDEKLKLLGWSARRAKHKLTVPGQSHSLTCLYQNNGLPLLSWHEPGSGGKVAMYKILRRSADGKLADGSNGTWREIAYSFTNEFAIKNQPSGHRLEFVVRAVNRAGEGVESNVVELTL